MELAPPRGTKVAVYAFLTLLVACGALGLEVWPFSAFRLFSQTRSGVQPRWELVRVDGDGAEAPVDLAAMGRAFRQTSHLLPELAVAPAARRADACDAWLAHETDARSLRVYRDLLRSPAPGRPYVIDQHVLRFTCERTS